MLKTPNIAGKTWGELFREISGPVRLPKIASMNHFPHSERFYRLLKEGSWVVLGQSTAIVGILISVRILTELLTPAEYGELALGMTMATLVHQTILGPLGSGVTRFYAPALEQGDLGGYLKAVRRLTLSATGIIGVWILLPVIVLLIAGWAEWLLLSIAALVVALLSGFNSILSGIQNAARQRAIVALHQGIEPWMRFVGAIGLFFLFGSTSWVAMTGYAAGTLLVLGSQYLFFYINIPSYKVTTADGKIWSEKIWKYSWPFATWGVFYWAQGASDRWALQFFSTTQEVGLYAVLFQLGYYPTSILTGMAVQLLAPIFFQRAGDASDCARNAKVSDLSWKLTGLSLGATGGIFLVALLFHVEIFRIFVGKEYLTISYLLPWMLLAGGIFAAGQTMALNLQSQMKTQLMLKAKIIPAVSGVLFNLMGAYWYKMNGVVLAGVLFSIFYTIWMVILSLKTTGD